MSLWILSTKLLLMGQESYLSREAGKCSGISQPCKSLAGKMVRKNVMTPYLRIVDRACERAFGYAPFLAKQQAARQAGWRMRLDDDPCQFIPSLREVLPAYEASVGGDGTLEWQGWHYRDMQDDVLRYWPNEAVTIRPSPVSEAMI